MVECKSCFHRDGFRRTAPHPKTSTVKDMGVGLDGRSQNGGNVFRDPTCILKWNCNHKPVLYSEPKEADAYYSHLIKDNGHMRRTPHPLGIKSVLSPRAAPQALPWPGRLRAS